MFVCEISEQRFDPSRPWEVSVFLSKAFYNWAIKRNGALKFKPLFLNSRETNYKRLIDCDGACPRRQINLPMARGVIKKPFGATGWRALVIGWLQDLNAILSKEPVMCERSYGLYERPFQDARLCFCVPLSKHLASYLVASLASLTKFWRHSSDFRWPCSLHHALLISSVLIASIFLSRSDISDA